MRDGPQALRESEMDQRAPQPRVRPGAAYRREFFDAVMACRPGSLLDVGCGDGAFIRAASQAGVRCTGLEIDRTLVAGLSESGLDVQMGFAEKLPFAGASFDVVVLAYVAHHVEHLPRALVEAARVASRAILILEPWYDVTLPSQRVALEYDRWSKVIDRRTGMIHNPPPTVPELLQPLAAAGFDRNVDYRQRVLLAPWALDEVIAAGERQLALVENDAQLAAQFATILDKARLHGISEDGALMMAATTARDL